MIQEKQYMNPYLAGFLLGLLIVLAIYLNGDGLGASGAVKNAVIGTMDTIAPQASLKIPYIKAYKVTHPESPWKSWLIWEIIGVMIGAFVSGLIAGRNRFTIERGKRLSSKARLLAAFIGGTLFGIGSQFGRGCTSGAGLDGMAVFSVAGFLITFAIFGTAYILAPFFKKLWL